MCYVCMKTLANSLPSESEREVSNYRRFHQKSKLLIVTPRVVLFDAKINTFQSLIYETKTGFVQTFPTSSLSLSLAVILWRSSKDPILSNSKLLTMHITNVIQILITTTTHIHQQLCIPWHILGNLHSVCQSMC